MSGESVRRQLTKLIRLMTTDSNQAAELAAWLVENAPAVERYREAKQDISAAIQSLTAARSKLEAAE